MEANILTEKILMGMEDGMVKSWLEAMLPSVLSFFWAVVLALLTWWIGRKIVNIFVKGTDKSLTRHGVEPGLRQFLVSIVKYIGNIILIVAILGLFGITASSIAAAVAAMGVTAGLSLQGALSNFAGGVLILLLHPFRVGDYIIEDSNKNEGTVTEISIIYTTLTSMDGRKIVIPNGTLANASLTNVNGFSKRRLDIKVGIGYEDDVKKAKAILNEIAQQEPLRIPSEAIDVFLWDFGDSAIMMGLRFWVKSQDYWAVKWKTNELIKEKFDEAGINIAYNQLDVHIIGDK